MATATATAIAIAIAIAHHGRCARASRRWEKLHARERWIVSACLFVDVRGEAPNNAILAKKEASCPLRPSCSLVLRYVCISGGKRRKRCFREPDFFCFFHPSDCRPADICLRANPQKKDDWIVYGFPSVACLK